MEYHKIQSIYKRDPETKLRTFLDEFSTPEFELLRDIDWVFTEKVDGTNIRIMWDGKVRFGGRTDTSQIPTFLLNKLQDMFNPEMFASFENICLCGEGYGPKIQKRGGNYREDASFVLFDVNIDGWWLRREEVEDIAKKMNLDVVPIIGHGTLKDMVSMTKGGFKSQWGDFEAEGIVARPRVELFDRAGNRIITKVKCRDFR